MKFEFIAMVLFLTSSVSAETNFTLRFGTDFYDPRYFSFDEAFAVLSASGLDINSLQVQWQEAVIPHHYYWARGDSLISAAWSAGTEVHFRIDQAQIPAFLPFSCDFSRWCDFNYFPEYYDLLELVVARYKPGGLLAQQPGNGVTHYNLMQELDLWWASVDYTTEPPSNVPGPEMEIEALVDFHIASLNILKDQINDPVMPLGLMGQPYFENYGYYPRGFSCAGLDSEDDFVNFLEAVLDEFQERGVTPDAIDWHPFTLRNDPLNPGPTDTYWTVGPWPSFAHWAGKYYSDRSSLYEDILEEYGMEIPTQSLEGASTPYWDCTKPEFRTIENHCSFQLSSNAEQAVNGRHNIVMFDLDFDGITISAGCQPEDFSYDDWWDGVNGDTADKLLEAYTKQARLLTGTYCIGRDDVANLGTPTVYMHTFHSPESELNVYQLRAKNPTGVSIISFPVNTRYLYRHQMLGNLIEFIDLGPIRPWTINRSWDYGWEVVWFEETDSFGNKESQEIAFGIEYTINPVRSSEELCFDLTGLDQNVDHTFHIYDLTGRIVSSTQVEASRSEVRLVINHAEMPIGMYMAIVEEYPKEVISFVLID